MTQAQLASAVLEHMVVVAAGATPATADQTLAETIVGRIWARLRPLKLAPFPVSAIPDEAQKQFIDIAAKDLGPAFGVASDRMLLFLENAKRAELDLQRQYAGPQQPRTIEREYW